MLRSLAIQLGRPLASEQQQQQQHPHGTNNQQQLTDTKSFKRPKTVLFLQAFS